MIANRPSTKLTTFTPTDAKLGRLLMWYHRHSDESLCIHNQHLGLLSQLKTGDINKMRYTEKNRWVILLKAVETRWRMCKKLRVNKQLPITDFFMAQPSRKDASANATSCVAVKLTSRCT